MADVPLIMRIDFSSKDHRRCWSELAANQSSHYTLGLRCRRSKDVDRTLRRADRIAADS